MRELIARTRGMSLASFAHGDMPIARLIEIRGTKPNPGESPISLVPVLMQMRNLPPVNAEGGNVRFSEFAIENEHARFDLTFDLIETTDGLQCHLAYNADIFDAKSARKILAEFAALAAAFADAPDSRLSSLSFAGRRKR